MEEFKVKIINSDYSEIDDIANLIHYVTQPRINYLGEFYIGCRNLYLGNLINCDIIIEQILRIKNIYRQNWGRKMLHVIISPDFLNAFSGKQLYEIAGQIADKHFAGHQLIFAVHEDTDYKHIHFAINSINMIHGHRLDIVLPALKNDIINITTNYNPKSHYGMLQMMDMLGITKEEFYKIFGE